MKIINIKNQVFRIAVPICLQNCGKFNLKKTTMSRKCQQLKITIIKSFHVLMKTDFTSGKKKKRTKIRCVSYRIVSQSMTCGIYHHHGNGKLNI